MDDKVSFVIASTTILVMILFVVSCFLGIQCVYVNYFETVPVKCWVDGGLVYDGPSAGIDIDTAGANTKVSITGGYLYLFPKKYYTSKNVILEGEKINFKKQ